MKTKLNTFWFVTVFSIGFSSFSAILADAPVVDHSVRPDRTERIDFDQRNYDGSSSTASDNISLRLQRVENQIKNINSQNFAEKIEVLQQKNQTNTGDLEHVNHELAQISKKLKVFYQDLNQRLNELAAKTTSEIKASATTPLSITDDTHKPDAGKSLENSLDNSANHNAKIGTELVPATAESMTKIFTEEQKQPIETTNFVQHNASETTNRNRAFLQEQTLYQEAINLLSKKENESKEKLRVYLKKYPNGLYVANSHYWLGDINFKQGNFDIAEEEFKIILKNYPKSSRIPDAVLKLALTCQQQGRDKQAKKYFQQLLKEFPKTTAAQLARQQQ